MPATSNTQQTVAVADSPRTCRLQYGEYGCASDVSMRSSNSPIRRPRQPSGYNRPFSVAFSLADDLQA